MSLPIVLMGLIAVWALSFFAVLALVCAAKEDQDLARRSLAAERAERETARDDRVRSEFEAIVASSYGV